jgi:hypothetical protein
MAQENEEGKKEERIDGEVHSRPDNQARTRRRKGLGKGRGDSKQATEDGGVQLLSETKRSNCASPSPLVHGGIARQGPQCRERTGAHETQERQAEEALAETSSRTRKTNQAEGNQTEFSHLNCWRRNEACTIPDVRCQRFDDSSHLEFSEIF